MKQTELDVTKVMVLLQRRYNDIREIHKLTKELAEALARNDDVSTSMILQMRAEEMGKADNCTNEIWQLGENDRKAQEKLRLLVVSEPGEDAGENLEEKKIFEIRRKTQAMIDEIREIDQRLSQKLAGEKSYYEKAAR
ncbi:MAG: hypothetical protein HFI31_07740 [Lachnospiraceae bacterium]|jgi:hypothetical protein|nr:hypothetical protein [Lachnospiraceae bacterium]MCI8995957.1 hypothetical protein [Lachnospiraceae bacterium]MCI9134062.1 hypothetical protein [Lachnospiraceae bacterium]